MPEAPITAGIRTVRVPDGPAGRVDRFVADATGLSRSYVQKLISDGRLTADGVPLRANTVEGAGDGRPSSTCRRRRRSIWRPTPDIPLRIVYEDDDLLDRRQAVGTRRPPVGRTSTMATRWSTPCSPAPAGRSTAGSPASPGRASSIGWTATRAAC